MSEYRRFVAYIYGYTDGRKNKNTGFAKVESRNGICRMQIHLQKTPQEEKALNIYGFVREGGWLLGILLGQLSGQGTEAEARIQTPAQKIGGSGYALSQLAGLWIEGSQGRKYVTVFDDEGIDTEKLVTELPGEKADPKDTRLAEERSIKETGEVFTEKKEEEKEALHTEKEKEVRREKAAATVGEETEAADGGRTETAYTEETAGAEKIFIEAERIEPEEGNAEAEKTEPEAEGAEAEKEEPEVRSAEAEKEGPEEGSAEAEKAEPEVRSAEAEKTESEEGYTEAKEQIHDEKAKADSQKLHAQEAAVCPVSDYRCRNCHPQSVSLEQKWQALSSRCPHFCPFADQEMVDCLQITPRELNFIRQGNGRMGNNSFLMHGFCNYRHLLLGKRHDGGFVLGIPGIFENQELFMANMFGFPEFKEAGSKHPRGRFGYWCRKL